MAFHYCDPPYVGANQGHYGGYTQEHFNELLNTLSRIKGMVFTSSFSCFNSSVFLNIFSIKVKFSPSLSVACSLHFIRLFSLDTILLRRVCRRCTSCVGLNLSYASSCEGAAGSNMRLYLIQWSSTVSQASISSNSCHSCCCRVRAWLSWSAGRALSCSLSEQAFSQCFFLARYTGCRAWG